MPQSTRFARAALKQVGSGSSVTLCSALPVGVGQLPQAHRLSKRAKQRLKWLDYRNTHTVTQTCRHFAIPRSTLNRWTQRFDPHDLRTLEDRSSRPRTVRQRTWGARAVNAVLAVRQQYPRWGKAKLAVLLARQGIVLAVSMIGRILRYLRQRRLLVEPRSVRASSGPGTPVRTPNANRRGCRSRKKHQGIWYRSTRCGSLRCQEWCAITSPPSMSSRATASSGCVRRRARGRPGTSSVRYAGAVPWDQWHPDRRRE